MRLLNTFFGQVLRKGDVDFISNGARNAVVNLNVDLTNGQGGVINGLDVYSSIDNLSVLITPGTFYSYGNFSSQNNQGGGERAQIYTTQTFTGLPSTSPIANQPSYLVVYVKIASQNSNPDPTQLQTTATSINIQTGQNVPTQNYPVGTIAVSNPLLLNQIGTLNGIPLAILQVDYVGTSQISSNGTIQSIDTSIKSDYIVGGAVDVAKKSILDAAIPSGFITNRMIGSGQVAGYNFAAGTIDSAAIATWDNSDNVTFSGNGIATGHLKNGAVTLSKINYISGLNDFSDRNFIINSSFEASATTPPQSWTFNGSPGSSATVVANPNISWDGNNSLLFIGGATGSPAVSTTQTISQNIQFAGPINGENITAYFYINPQTNFNGTDAFNGVLTFYNNITDAKNGNNAVSSQVFAGYSGVSTGGYIQVQTLAPITVPATGTQINVVNISVGGQFSNKVYMDAVYLGLTSITPKFNVSLNEQLSPTLNASNITQGLMNGGFISPGTVTPNLIPLAAGGTTPNVNGGILGSQIAPYTISGGIGGNIAPNSITDNELAAGIAAVPMGCVLMFLPWSVGGVSIFTTNLAANPGQQGCPVGFNFVTSMDGRLPIGIQPASNLAGFTTPGNQFGSAINPITANGNYTEITADSAGGHTHTPGAVDQTYTSGGGQDVWHNTASSNPGGHTHGVPLPITTVLWCQKVA